MLCERELESRYEVMAEQYTTTSTSRARRPSPSPARCCSRRRSSGWATSATPKAARRRAPRGRSSSGLVDEFVEAIFALEAANAPTRTPSDVLVGAKYVATRSSPAMDAVREVADKLERVVADDLWPLPKYSEILFVK